MAEKMDQRTIRMSEAAWDLVQSVASQGGVAIGKALEALALQGAAANAREWGLKPIDVSVLKSRLRDMGFGPELEAGGAGDAPEGEDLITRHAPGYLIYIADITRPAETGTRVELGVDMHKFLTENPDALPTLVS